jgi:hypothetical protein
MSNAIALRPEQQVPSTLADIERMAASISKSGLFPGMKTQEQAMALMLLAHAEGMHPAIAARDFDVIQGKPAKKAEAMMRDFMRSGGKVEWHELTDAAAEATFSHPQGGSLKLRWDMDRAKKAELGGKDMWKKYPRQMLRARLISEGVRTVFPLATSGMYVPEEVQDFQPAPMQDVTPKPSAQEKLAKLATAGFAEADPLAEALVSRLSPTPVYSFTDPDGVVSQVTGAEWLVQAEIALNTALHPDEFWKENEPVFYQIQESAQKNGAKKALTTCGRVADLAHQAMQPVEP